MDYLSKFISQQVNHWYTQKLLNLHVNLYPATLLTVSIKSRRFLVESVGSFKYRIMLS